MNEQEEEDDIVTEFLSESHRHLDRMRGSLETLTETPDRELVDEIFRGIHSIKGTAGALDFERLQVVSHTCENVLDAIRQGRLVARPKVRGLLIESIPLIRRLLASIEARGHDRSVDVRPLLERLRALCEQAGISLPKQPDDLEVVADERTSVRPGNDDTPLLGEVLVQAGYITEEDVVLALREQRQGDPRRLGEILIDMASLKPQVVKNALEQQGGSSREAQLEGIPVELAKLDQLMATIGELVLVRNRIESFSEALIDRRFDAASSRLAVITAELQDWVMRARTQPIETIWEVFPRSLRHLKAECGKEARIEMHGEATALDRSVLEALRDPMSHLVRNCVDHGIESPNERRAVGKAVEGVVALRAHHEGGQVTVEVTDDGGGIDPHRIRDKAVSRGLISEDLGARMSDDECLDLIFEPGLSTSVEVTNVSGRGVGMDVVRTNIQRIGGDVAVQSSQGRGTKFVITIPLSLAIIPVLLVESGGDRYAVPQTSVLEVLRIVSVDKEIERLGDVAVFRLRGQLLPLIDLCAVLEVESRSDASETHIVVVQTGERCFGLVVDKILDASEIVVRPVSRHVKQIGAYAGATVLRDGCVALLLDVAAVGRRAAVWDPITDEKSCVVQTADDSGDPERSWLLVEGADHRHVALPLSDVTRLEVIEASRIEALGDHEVVRYRGEIMSLIRLGRGTDATSGLEEPVHIIVHDYRGRRVGIVVHRVLDIVSAKLGPRHAASGGPGIREAAVIQGRVVSLLDVNALISAVLCGPPSRSTPEVMSPTAVAANA